MRQLAWLVLTAASVVPTLTAAQTPGQTAQDASSSPSQTGPSLKASANVVLVPALVRDARGNVVFTLKAEDFVLKDDGVEQKLTLDDDTDSQPLALLVLIEVGGAGAREFNKYDSIAPPLAPMLDSIVGHVPHRVAVVTFDSHADLLQPFTDNLDTAADALRSLRPGCGRQHHLENCAWPGAIHDKPLGDNGAAILDALAFSVDLLRKQPPAYRRAILMISETLDRGSQTTLEAALRAVTETNTAIYAVGFSTGKSEAAHYGAREMPTQPGRATFEQHHPNPPNGCMGKDPDPDPDATTNKAIQFYDCMTQLMPPLAFAKMLAILATDSMKRNIPQTVARLTGGEYFNLENPKYLERDLAAISNHVPNRYVLSYQPHAPHEGFHAVELKLKDRPGLEINARTGYWIDQAGDQRSGQAAGQPVGQTNGPEVKDRGSKDRE